MGFRAKIDKKSFMYIDCLVFTHPKNESDIVFFSSAL